MLDKHKVSLRQCVLILSGVVVFLLVGSITVLLLAQNLSAPSTGNIRVVARAPQPVNLSSNTLFTGNVYWGRYINDWSQASALSYQYPFSRLGEFGRDQYDAWISGLECPVTSGVNMTSAEEDATLAFNCSPDYLPEAAKWFTIFSLANNHTDNQGIAGFTETKTHLAENSIQYFGHYDYQNVDDVCEVVGLPTKATLDDGSVTNGTLPVAMCGYHGVFGVPTDESIAAIQKYAPYMPVVAMPHMGAEYRSSTDELKTNAYHQMIDSGADMVLGDHPHWIQNTESYNGHLIVYSMGNFIFDQQDTFEVTRSAAIRVVISTVGDNKDLGKWLQLGEKCRMFKDSCLADAKAQGLTKLDLEYKFGAIGTNDADKINKPATPDQQSSILQRLNWQYTMNSLQPPYSSL